jgi:hypothetical protein
MITTNAQITKAQDKATELTDAQVYDAIYRSSGQEKWTAEEAGFRAFHAARNALCRGPGSQRSKAARKLDNALSALSTLTPAERLGFLVLARIEIKGTLNVPDDDSDAL